MARLKIPAVLLVFASIIGLLQCCGDKDAAGAPTIAFKVVAESPHEITSYCQGFFIEDGVLWESSGIKGESKLKKIDLATRKVQREILLDEGIFAEGSCYLDGKIYQLTWKSGVCYVYSPAMIRIARFNYKGDGWGLTTDGKQLVMSNGSADLVFRDPADFKELRRITVTDGDREVEKLNELEWIEGEIWANVYQTTRIAIINPETGKVRAWLECEPLRKKVSNAEADVLNGIAYDKASKKIHVTGKYWSTSFEIELEK